MAYINGVFAVALVLGAVYGFVQTGSVVSLVMGVLFGILLGFCAVIINTARKNLGLSASMVVLGVLCAVMSYRFFITFKIMPAGIIALLSGILLARNYFAMENKKNIE